VVDDDGVAGYRIRLATPDDHAVVLYQRRRMFEDMGEGDVVALERMAAASAPLIADGLRDGTYRGWLVEQDGAVVAGGGIIGLAFQASPRDSEARRWWIVNVYVEPAHRRRGLARWIVETIVAWSRAAGLASVNLHASAEGRALYESLGFAPTNEMRLRLK
jgi:GNAT superfamily N-acetyltransferase